MNAIAGHRGPLELVLFLPREARRARFEIAETADGWCLASETGSAYDGTSRRVIATDVEPLVRELVRVAAAMLTVGYAVERCTLRNRTPLA
jgi:hypothetical protein